MKKVLFLSIIIAILAAFFASSHPDGLDKAAELFGFAPRAQEHQALMPSYSFPLIKNGPASTAVSGIAGVLIVSGLFLGLKKFLSR